MGVFVCVRATWAALYGKIGWMDEFIVAASVIIAAIVGLLLIVLVAKWQNRALWFATPIMLWPTNTIYVQAAVVILLALGTVYGSRSKLWATRKPVLLFLAFAAWMTFVFVYHGSPIVVEADAARNHFLAMLLSVAMVPIVALQRPPLVPTLKAMALSGAAVSIFVLVTYGETAGRVSSETHNPNAVGLAAALALLASIAVAMLTGKAIWLLLTIPSVLVFVGSQNRSGLIVIVVGIVLLWLLQRTGPMRVVGALAILVAAPFAVDIVLASQRAIFAERETQNFEVTAREAVLELATRLTIENPVVGVGYRHFSDYSGAQLGMALNTHNDYARIAAEGGLLAVVLLGGIVLRVLTFREPTREGRILRSLTIAAALTLVFGNLITDFRVTWVLWVLLGVCWSTTRNPAGKKPALKRASPRPSVQAARGTS